MGNDGLDSTTEEKTMEQNVNAETFGAQFLQEMTETRYGCECADVAGWQVLHPDSDGFSAEPIYKRR